MPGTEPSDSSPPDSPASDSPASAYSPLYWSPGGGETTEAKALAAAGEPESWAEVFRGTTHLGVGAHPDDLEIAFAHGIVECYRRDDRGFLGVVTCDGRGSSRIGPYAQTRDEEMRRIRREEQLSAAAVGDYSALVMLDLPSAEVKKGAGELVSRLARIIEAARPQVLYTHSPLDQHDTHVAVCAATVAAVRQVPREARPERMFGCEVWGSLDGVEHPAKCSLDVSAQPELQEELLRVFASQISGGKRYDLAALGRRRAQATFSQSHQQDLASGVILALDLTLLLTDPSLPLIAFAERILEESKTRTLDRLQRHRAP